MKSLRICGCALLCVFYFGVLGCKDEKENKSGLPVIHKITITNCVPDQDTVGINDGDEVEWVPDINYQVTFLMTSTPSGPKVPSATNPFTINAHTSVPYVMHAPSNCSAVGCYYKYSLTRVNNIPDPLPCIDPGIRIVPVHPSTDR